MVPSKFNALYKTFEIRVILEWQQFNMAMTSLGTVASSLYADRDSSKSYLQQVR